MLVLTASHGDTIVIQTPSGPITVFFRTDPEIRRRMRVGIDAPRAWPIKFNRNGWDPDTQDVETKTCTVKDSAALRASSTALRSPRVARKGAPGPRGASAS